MGNYFKIANPQKFIILEWMHPTKSSKDEFKNDLKKISSQKFLQNFVDALSVLYWSKYEQTPILSPFNYYLYSVGIIRDRKKAFLASMKMRRSQQEERKLSLKNTTQCNLSLSNIYIQAKIQNVKTTKTSSFFRRKKTLLLLLNIQKQMIISISRVDSRRASS